MSVNEAQKTIFLHPMKAHFGGSLQGIKMALWGLSFKPETDDIREAPSLYMIDKLVAEAVQRSWRSTPRPCPTSRAASGIPSITRNRRWMPSTMPTAC